MMNLHSTHKTDGFMSSAEKQNEETTIKYHHRFQRESAGSWLNLDLFRQPKIGLSYELLRTRANPLHNSVAKCEKLI